ncbi:MAG: DUF3299 domain-containing protein [Azoarcus sp.]|jgi:hypothetical protein|nr:DUF3299 domain-containing protein [Azoarcus sp.]
MNVRTKSFKSFIALALLSVACGGAYWYVGYVVSVAEQSIPAADYQEIPWEALIPESWNPQEVFTDLDLGNLPASDGDPRVEKAYDEFIKEWARAPVNEKMAGRRIKIPAFVVPLDWENDTELRELLLVPYFGACIHSPPPPANQIIHVRLKKPLGGLRAMDAVWAYGTISVEKNDYGVLGSSGYGMTVDKIEPYQ